MRYTYKNILKRLLKNYDNNPTDDPFDEDLFHLCRSNKKVYKAFVTLSAKDLITFQKDINGEIYDAQITNAGFTYFSDKHHNHRDRLLTRLLDIVVAFITAFITYFLMPHLCDWLNLVWK